jgi:hypothetical protein
MSDLPVPDLVLPTKITDPPGAGHYYSAATMARELKRLRAELATAQGVIAAFPAIEQDLDGYKQRAERAEAERDEAFQKGWDAGQKSTEPERDALRREVELLRQYGKKDRTAMADAAMRGKEQSND